jgi:hypothetical protein
MARLHFRREFIRGHALIVRFVLDSLVFTTILSRYFTTGILQLMLGGSSDPLMHPLEVPPLLLQLFKRDSAGGYGSR